MRELKFRCWGIKENKYLKLHSIHLSTSKVIVSYYGVGGGNISKALKDVIIEQYTGLKDKNGKEIYEGDIVKMPDWQVKPKYEVVKYYKAGFDPFQEGCMECWSPDGDEVEVIGNIHENKELLNVQ